MYIRYIHKPKPPFSGLPFFGRARGKNAGSNSGEFLPF
ncbi:hypothetical protein LEP1GSC061_1876 [Leptospira wolffii serovar Khorat str. Khorat-H2]|nr:hypothetical protein LEP1GSC061_1876 [Leptospira wolffii serovar Khorat str. Khorat-H2]